MATGLRRAAREERVLFHYNGHGVPKPTANGEIWVFNRSISYGRTDQEQSSHGQFQVLHPVHPTVHLRLAELDGEPQHLCVSVPRHNFTGS